MLARMVVISHVQQPDDLFQAAEHHLAVDDDLVVLAAKIVRSLPGVFQVDGIGVHADGKGADGLAQLFGGNGAHQGRVQPAGKQEAHGCIGVQPLFHTGDQLFADVLQDGGHIVLHGGGHIRNVLVAHKAAVAVVAADREGTDIIAPADQVAHLGGKGDLVLDLE